MQIGCLGEIVFQVSDNTVETISNLEWSGSARYSEHQRHCSNALTEFVGLDPDKITIEIQLSAYLGVSVQEEINKIWDYERRGQAVPLVIGDKAYGKYRWTIISHKFQAQTFDGRGNVLIAAVSVELGEYLKE